MDFSFELDGVDETTGMLERIRNLNRLSRQMKIVTLRLQKRLKKYPSVNRRTRASVYGVQPLTGMINGHSVTFMSSFKTFKQHCWFYATLRDNPGQFPYRRTKHLGQAWTEKVQFIAGGVEGIVGNITPYGPLVQDRDQQAEFHKGEWDTAQDILDEMSDEIFSTLGEAFAAEA